MGRPLSPVKSESSDRESPEQRPTPLEAKSNSSSDGDREDDEGDDDFQMPQEEEWRDPSDGGVLTRVFEAAEAGEAEELRELLGRLNVDVNTPGEDGDSALHLACLYGREACVERLLNASASATAVDREGSTPLHDAAAGGYIGIVRLLLDAGADCCINATDSDGETPLHTAARGAHTDLVALLLEKGANPCVENAAGNMPEQEARGCPDMQAVLRLARQET